MNHLWQVFADMDRSDLFVIAVSVLAIAAVGLWAWLAPRPRCPFCHATSPRWCNRFDWYGDGNDCSWRQFK